jgi:hypothetical protein
VRCGTPCRCVAGIGQHDTFWHAVIYGSPDLVECDLRLGRERDLLRHAGLLAPRPIIRPRLGEIEPQRDRQARMIRCNRERHGDLAVVLLAKLAAILSCHADRVLALLRDAGVVDDLLTRRLRHEVVQRLMLGTNLSRRHTRGHRLDALPLARQQQPGAILQKRPAPIGVADGLAQMLDVRMKTQRHAIRGAQVHVRLARNESRICCIAQFRRL